MSTGTKEAGYFFHGSFPGAREGHIIQIDTKIINITIGHHSSSILKQIFEINITCT